MALTSTWRFYPSSWHMWLYDNMHLPAIYDSSIQAPPIGSRQVVTTSNSYYVVVYKLSNMHLFYVNISNSKNEWPTLGYHSYINSRNNIISILWLVNKQNWQSVTVVLRPHQHNALYILNYSKSFCPRYNLHESGSPLF